MSLNRQMADQWIAGQFAEALPDTVLLDNAAGSLTCRLSVEAMARVLPHSNIQSMGCHYRFANELRAILVDSQRKIAAFMNAGSPNEVVVGPSATVLLANLARSFSASLRPGDEVVVTHVDHHANVGPWEALAPKGVVIRRWRLRPDRYVLDVSDLAALMSDKTKLVCMTHCSNVLGTVQPIKEAASLAREYGAKVIVDGVAHAPHAEVDVQASGADFYVYSAYKAFGPHYSALWGRYELLEQLPGVNHSFVSETDVPYKFQPGNPNFELTVGMAGATEYFIGLGKALANQSPHAEDPRTCLRLAYSIIE